VKGCGNAVHLNKNQCLKHYKDNEGYAYGLDADLKNKMDAKYDPELENKARNWLESVTGGKQRGTFQEWLKDGRVLCAAMNKLKPNSITVNGQSSAFKERENVANYLAACKTYGVKEMDLFMTEDLYENKNMGQVVQNISALASVAHTKGAKYGKSTGLGVQMSQENRREFSAETLASGNAIPSRQTQGSHGYQDESAKVTLDRQIIKNVSGHTASSVPSKQTQGDLGYETKTGSGLDKIIKNTSELEANKGGSQSKSPSRGSVKPSGGSTQTSASSFCSNCGTKSTGGKFCSSCGTGL
jgi:hypothetical protein